VGLETEADTSATVRAWSWLAAAPDQIYTSKSRATLAIIDLLERRSRQVWSEIVSAAWSDVIQRAQQLCGSRIGLRHCVQGLEVALGNNKLPLSSVVCSAFPTTYTAVVNQSHVADEADRLFSYEWDKGRALRTSLIESYFYSDWPPGDLALIAESSFGLRKLFKRLWRKWRGAMYIERMIRDLGSRSGTEAAACKLALSSLLANPDFYEAWD
jgi:hypothetical protein